MLVNIIRINHLSRNLVLQNLFSTYFYIFKGLSLKNKYNYQNRIVKIIQGSDKINFFLQTKTIGSTQKSFRTLKSKTVNINRNI